MRNLAASLCFLAPLATTQGVAAQRTWIIDWNNGPGADFTDLPPAVAAAAPGDTIRARRGGYTGTVIDKPLRIYGEYPTSIYSGRLSVVGLPAGTSVVLRGIHLIEGFRFLDNAGSVHVESGWEGSDRYADRGLIRDCALVTFTGWDSFNGLLCVRSMVAVSDSRFTGVGDLGLLTLSAPGIEAADSTIYLSNTEVWGHSSTVVCRFCPRDTTASEGALLAGSRLFADGVSSIRGGWSSVRQPGGPTDQPAIVARDSEIVLDADTVVLGSPNATAIVSNRAPSVRTVAGLAARGAPPAGSVMATLDGPPGSPVLLLVSSPPPGVAHSPFGDYALDPATATVVAQGVFDADGAWSTSIPVPATPLLGGTPIMLQGLVANPELLLTMPAGVILW